MARFKPSPMILSISGQLGGQTFAAGRGTQVIRKRPKAHRNSSPAQQASQAIRIRLQRSWAALTEAERTQWRAIATKPTFPLGGFSTKLLSGFQVYVRANMIRHNYGLSPSDLPVALSPTSIPEGIIVTSSEISGPGLEITPTVVTPLYRVLIYAAMTMSTYTPASRYHWKFIAPRVYVGAPKFQMLTPWLEKFPKPVLDQPITLRVDTYADQNRLVSRLVRSVVTTAP